MPAQSTSSPLSPSTRKKAERILALLQDECRAADSDFRIPITTRYIEELVALGPEALPVIVDAIDNVTKRGASFGWLVAVTNMCAAIGRIGGPTAFDLLAHYALVASTNASVKEIRIAAIRGLGQLGDQRGRDILARVLTDFAGFESQAREELQRLGETHDAILNAAPPWHAGVNLRDPLAIARAFTNELRKEVPDFGAFERVIATLDNTRRYTAWNELAAILRDSSRNSRTQRQAGQCWVQALSCDPSPDCFNWPALSEDVIPVELKVDFERCYRTWGPSTERASESERVAMVKRLERLLGRPGDILEVVDGTPV
jgi:PBS lyase HEAT-like repeat.